MLNAHDLQKAFESETARRKTLDSAWLSLQAAISIVDQRLKLITELLDLHSQEAELQAPLASAFGLAHESQSEESRLSRRVKAVSSMAQSNDDADAGGISRTLGKRIYAWVAEYLNLPGRQKSNVERLFEKLDPELRAEIESVQSTNSALFRFRRLLRRNKDDFDVDRTTGIVTYLRYAPPRDFGGNLSPAPSGSGSGGKSGIVVFAKRFDETTDDWALQYRLTHAGKEYELPTSAFIRHLLGGPGREVDMNFEDDLIPLAVATTTDGRKVLESYRNGEWTPDLDYRLPVSSRKLQAPSATAKGEAATNAAS